MWNTEFRLNKINNIINLLSFYSGKCWFWWAVRGFSMIDELGLSTWKLKNCFVKYVSCFVLWPLFIFMSPGNTELWAVFKGCWWHWTLQSTRLVPLLPALSEAPALPSDALWREAQAEPIRQKLTLVLFPCNSELVITPWGWWYHEWALSAASKWVAYLACY